MEHGLSDACCMHFHTPAKSCTQLAALLLNDACKNRQFAHTRERVKVYVQLDYVLLDSVCAPMLLCGPAVVGASSNAWGRGTSASDKERKKE